MGVKPTVRSTVKTSLLAKENLIDRTIETWRPRLQCDLSREDGRQIVGNVTGFFSILAEWSLAELAEPAEANSQSNYIGEHGEVRHDR